MFKRFITLLFVASFIWSCTNKNAGTLLSTDALLMGPDPTAGVVQYLTAGTPIEYIGEQPYPNEGFAKVRVGKQEGYVLARSVVFGGKPMVANESINGTASQNSSILFPITYAGGFLLYDSVAGDKTHVYSVLSTTHGWVETQFLSTDPEDIAVAAVINRMVNGTQRDTESSAVFQEAALKYPNNRFLQTFKVDLSEPSDADLVGMQSKLIFAYDKAQNSITFLKMHVTSIANTLLADLLPRIQGDNEYGYNDDEGKFVSTIPTEKYFYKYIAALPSYVKVSGLSEGVTWDLMEKEEPEAAFFIYRIDRSPENLKTLYDQFRPLIESLITSGNLRDIRPESNTLIRIYDHIVALPNYRKVMSDVSKKVSAWDKKHTNSYGHIPGGYALLDKREVYEPIILQSVFDEDRSENKAMWYHSFWMRRFAEGNAEVVYEILQDLVTIQPGDAPEYAEGRDVYGDEVDEEGFGDAPDGYPTGNEEPTTATCTYNGFSSGDCLHYDFGDCGDYGDANTEDLSGAELELWQSLVTTVDGEEVGNPELVGKKFSITETVSYSEICNEGQGGMGSVAKVLSISRVDD